MLLASHSSWVATLFGRSIGGDGAGLARESAGELERDNLGLSV